MFEFLKEVNRSTYLPESMVRKAFAATLASEGLLGESLWEKDLPDLEFAAESAFLAAELHTGTVKDSNGYDKDDYLLIGARIYQRLYEIVLAKSGPKGTAKVFRYYANAGIGYYAARRNAIAAAIARRISEEIVRRESADNAIVSLYTIVAKVLENDLEGALSLCGTFRTAMIYQISEGDFVEDKQYSILLPFAAGAVLALADYLSGVLEGDLENANRAATRLKDKARLIDRLGYTEMANLLYRLSFSFSYLVKYSSWRLAELLPRKDEGQLEIVNAFVKNEIREKKYFLFHSQFQALFEEEILSKEGHQILSMPTGAGKTLLASLLMLRHLLEEGNGKIVFIVPTRALAREKLDEFESILSKNGLSYQICQITGEIVLDTKESLNANDILIMTQEKFDMLLRERFFEIPIKAVLADEFHNIFRSYRGLKLQISLDRLRQSDRYRNCNVYLISAILSDKTQSNVGNWLYPENATTDKASFRTSWRPTFTKRGIFDLASVGGGKKNRPEHWVVEFGDGSKSEVEAPENGIRSDSKKIAANHLARHFAKEDQVYFFMGSTSFIEPDALKLGNFLSQETYSYIGIEQKQELEIIIRKIRRIIGDCKLVDALKDGVATHYSALPVSIRRLMEKAVRKKLVPVIVATNTLADGLNLPVKTIIIPNPTLAGEALEGGLFLNLVGRAGRPFRSEEGQLIMLTSTGKNKVEIEQLEYYQRLSQNDLATENGPLAHWIASFSDNVVGILETRTMFVAVLESLLLAVVEEGIHTELARNRSLARSLLFQSTDPGLIESVLTLLDHLEKRFVEEYKILERREGKLLVTDLGRAVNASGFSPSSALSLLRWMSNHPESFEPLLKQRRMVQYKEFPNFWNQYFYHLEKTVEGEEYLRNCKATDRANVVLEWIRGEKIEKIARYNYGKDRLRAMSELEGSLSGIAAWGLYALNKLVDHCDWPLSNMQKVNLASLRDYCYYGDHSTISLLLFAKDVSRILLRDDVVALRKAIEAGELQDLTADPDQLRREEYLETIREVPGLLTEPDELIGNLRRVFKIKII